MVLSTLTGDRVGPHVRSGSRPMTGPNGFVTVTEDDDVSG
jgi:hypothetical protein